MEVRGSEISRTVQYTAACDSRSLKRTSHFTHTSSHTTCFSIAIVTRYAVL